MNKECGKKSTMIISAVTKEQFTFVAQMCFTGIFPCTFALQKKSHISRDIIVRVIFFSFFLVNKLIISAIFNF